jgi:hypothetical protein
MITIQRMGMLVAALGATTLIGCATGERSDGTDRTQQTLDNIPQQPNDAVCKNAGKTGHCLARVRTDTSGKIKPFATASGFGPSDLVSAYKIDTSQAGGTIMIVDAYDYPNAESDLAAYRSNYGLPACTTASGCLTIVNQEGQGSPLPAAAPSGDDWTVEAALDLDMASSACPNCKIILALADDDQGSGLYVANNDAATALNPNVVSNSWGGAEPSNSASMESLFNHPPIGYFVAAGDNGNTGAQSDYPSTSAFVTAVGGTTLATASNSRGWTEGAWSSGGSSCSLNIGKPSWQSIVSAATCANRAASDVASVADPNTGVAVYNAANGGWIVVGGTSAASPFVAGVYALYGIGASGPAYSYQHPANFFDVTTGTNGTCGTLMCNAGAGWDGPTGNGTVNGAAFSGGGTGSGGTGSGGTGSGGGCTPACSGKACGDDGCGGSCGTCDSGTSCSAGVCIANGGGGGTCAHPICSTGAAEDGTCDPCAQQVCASDSYCCDTAWDSVCVGEVGSICGESCSGGGGGGGGGSTCSHSICSSGTSLTGTCDSCASEICSQDSYCCDTKWDSQCVSEVTSICGENCD